MASLLAGCASVPKADMLADQAAKAFLVKPGKGNVYVYRKNAFVGSAIALQVIFDGQVAGATGPGTFLLWEASPGNHTVSSQTAESFTTTKLIVELGKSYYIEQNSSFGVAGPRVSLRQTDETEGQREVRKCSLVSNGLQ